MSESTNNRYQRRQGIWLWVHALSPSVASLIGSLLLAMTVVGLHLLLLSMDPNVAVRQIFGEVNDQVVDNYTGNFLDPIDRTLNTRTLSTLSTALLWGVIGWVIYSVLDFIATTLKEIRISRTDINMPSRDKVVQHPLRRTMFIRLLWRFFVGLLVVVYTVLALPYMAKLFRQDILLMRSSSSMDALEHIALSLLGWIIIFQVYVILLRLFVQRTRVTGEIVY